MKYLHNENSAIPSWPSKAFAAAVLLSLPAMVSQTAGSAERKPIGDLEIYKSASGNGASIFMMIDVSASMGKSSIETDYNNKCDKGGGNSYGELTSETITAYVIDDNGNYVEVEVPTEDNKDKKGTFTPKGCQAQNGDAKEFDRLSRLQMALIELLADKVEVQKGSEKVVSNASMLPSEYAIGTGIFGYGDGKQAKVIAPLGPLTAGKRIEIIKEIAKLAVDDNKNKPVSQALAEAGAYMMGTTTKTDTYSDYSGFDNSVDASKNDAKTKYESPLKAQQCSGNGIYLLTDGAPSLVINGAPSDELPTISKSLMNRSLQGSSLLVDTCDGTWDCMAEYTQKLRNPANPRGLPIKTAIAGYGDAFKGLTTTQTITADGEEVDVVDCSMGTAADDARNLCKLGQRYDDNELSNTNVFGNGGFYYIAGEKGISNTEISGSRSSEMIAKSIVDFAATLTQVITTSPSGTITIPDDPYRAANQLPYAYLPMLAPDTASSASIWKGNLKKYNLNQGTLFGNNNKLLYKDVAGRLEEATQDIWQTADFNIDNVVANNEIAAGGVYAQLQSPHSGLASVRKLYVEDITSATDNTPILRQLSVDTSGKPVGFSDLKDPLYTKDKELNKRRLLSFLGFDNLIDINGLATSETSVANLTMTVPSEAIKVLGGVVHSKPEAISYSSNLNDNGTIVDPRDDYALFGSMDGALHLVDADDGKEEFAIIPKAMLTSQPEAVVIDSKKAKLGEPYFGVDAPWLVMTDYTYALTAKKVTVDSAEGKGVFAYGGLRMGGEAFYGMNITDKTAPKILFTITPRQTSIDPVTNVTSTTGTAGFERLGQSWSKPTAAKIRLNKDDVNPTDVLIFGGGYDMAYEDDEYVATIDEPAKGNAIYMINAQSGELIWSASQSNNSNMINSITGGITVLDRDNDGLMDHLYAADLGGQVFRADFENARPAKFGFSEVTGFSSKRVIRILNTTPSAAADSKYTYRFYERPVVSFYRSEGGTNNGKIFAMVNVISGNRSAPLSTLRDNNTYANRVYGIIDSDVTDMDLYRTDFTLTVKDLVENDTDNERGLVNLATILDATPTPTKATKEAAKAGMVDGTKQGWYYPLTRFDGYNNVRYNKGIGNSIVINDLLYTTVYNPDKQYYEVDSCTAWIAGGSERQLYCLPYGICMDANSVSGTGGYIPAGQGIQEITLGAYNKDNTDMKVLIGTSTITDRIEAANRAGYGADTNKNSSNIGDVNYPNNGKPTQSDTNAIGDGSAPEFIFNERYTLQPRAWYKQTQEEEVTASEPVSN